MESMNNEVRISFAHASVEIAGFSLIDFYKLFAC